MKRIAILSGLAVILIVAAIWALKAEVNSRPPATAAPLATNGWIFYYGDGCPHCANVEKYFADKQVESKINFAKKEVYNNQANQQELIAKAGECGLDQRGIGIPLLWHDGQCLTGDVDIIKFFEQQLNKPQ